MVSDRLLIGFEKASMLAVVLSISTITLLSVDSIAEDLGNMLLAFDAALGWFFVGEFLIRLGLTQTEGVSLKAAGKYQFSFFGAVDLLSILPVIAPLVFGPSLVAFKALRLLRLMRVFKLVRHNKSLTRLIRVIQSIRYALLTTLFLTFLIVVITSVFMLLLRSSSVAPTRSAPISAGSTRHRRRSRCMAVSAIDTESSSSPQAE